MSAPSKPILDGLTLTECGELAARLDLVVDRSGGPSACWPYTGGSVVGGYGTVWTGQVSKRNVKTHRLAFELANGYSPATVDHLCHDPVDCQHRGPQDPHRLCCNPAHLGAATAGENAARGQAGVRRQECRAGHRMTPENTYETPAGQRQCRACSAALAREARRRQRLQAGPSPTRHDHNRPRGMSLKELGMWALAGQYNDGCWYWPGRGPREGYHSVSFEGKTVDVHRLIFEALNGPIPAGMVVDHLCHIPGECEGGLGCPHRGCIRPEHLGLATRAENVAPARASRKRAEECVHGHAFTDENTYVDARGSRHCKTCARERQASYRPAREPRTHCRAGHEMTGDNVAVTARGPICAECRRVRHERFAEKKRATQAG